MGVLALALCASDLRRQRHPRNYVASPSMLASCPKRLCMVTLSPHC